MFLKYCLGLVSVFASTAFAADVVIYRDYVSPDVNPLMVSHPGTVSVDSGSLSAWGSPGYPSYLALSKVFNGYPSTTLTTTTNLVSQADWDIFPGQTAGTSYVSVLLAAPTGGGVRFSYSNLQYSLSITDAESGTLLWQDNGLVSFLDKYSLDVSFNFSLDTQGSKHLLFSTSLMLGAGHGLIPSTDPSCASFACMDPYTDRFANINLGYRLNGNFAMPVPEPLACGLALTGFLTVASAQRKRKNTVS